MAASERVPGPKEPTRLRNTVIYSSDQFPTLEDMAKARRISRANFFKLAISTAFVASTGAGVLLNRTLDNNRRLESKPKKQLSIPELLSIPGENLVPDSDLADFQVLPFPGKDRTYQIPNGWTPSNPDKSKYRHGIGPNGTSCLEVDASEKSSWYSQEPITVEKGIYKLTLAVQINKERKQDVTGIQPEVSLFPLYQATNNGQPLFSATTAQLGMNEGQWNLVTADIAIPQSEPQGILFKLSGFDAKPNPALDASPKTIRFANLSLRRMIGPQEPDYPGNLSHRSSKA